MTPRVLVIGESLVDVIVAEDGSPISAHPGGSAVNVAVGLARLAVPTVFHTRLGTDANGRLVAAHLRDAGVDLSQGSIHAGATSTAIARTGVDGAVSYEFDLAWDPEEVDTRGVDLVHTGSIATALLPGADTVEAILERTDARISFDPNIRPSIVGDREDVRERVESIVARSYVAKASDEDLAWLYPGREASEVLERWAGLGAELVVVTRGADGAEALCHGLRTFTVAPRTAVVDTIGAGDSFMAGLLRGVVATGLADVPALLDFAVRCAAITVSRRGAQPPLLADVHPRPAGGHHAP